MHIKRNLEKKIEVALKSMPVVVLLGARQVGKTTLALNMIKKNLKKPVHYMDLELDSDLSKLSAAEDYLSRFENQLLILDEVQQKNDLFRILRGLIYKRKRAGEKAGHFLLLGSASKYVVQQSSES